MTDSSTIEVEVIDTAEPVDPRAPLHTAWICPGCKEACHFPSQAFENLRPGQDPSELQSTCGCGMVHRLTRAAGAMSVIPMGVTLDLEWRKKLDAKHRAERDAEQAASHARVTALREAGKCTHCEQTLPATKAGG